MILNQYFAQTALLVSVFDNREFNNSRYTHTYLLSLDVESPKPYHESSFIDRLFALQLFEQQVTSSHDRSHFFRHVNGRLQTTHIFSGKLDLLGLFSFLPLPPRPLPNNRVVILLGDAIGVIVE